MERTIQVVSYYWSPFLTITVVSVSVVVSDLSACLLCSRTASFIADRVSVIV